jgi:DNA (cytosine-5)-methyltransferase 1
MQGLETFVDAFAGIGGFRIAGEANGLKCIGAIENDKFARQTYAKNFGHEPQFGDIRSIDAKDIPDHDLFCAGFPCQAFSTAGKKLGFEDAKGTLFFEICRILDVKRPNYFLLENVKGLLIASYREADGTHVPGTSGQLFYRILESLGDLGYTVQWQVLDSRYWVAQHRERTYIVGSARGLPVPEVFPLFEDAREVADDTPWRSEALGNVANWSQPPSLRSNPNPWHQGQTGRVYGPGSTCPTLSTGREPMLDDKGRLRILTPTERERLMGFPDGWTEGVSDDQRFKQTGNAVVTKVAEAVIRRLVECHDNQGRRPEPKAIG